MRLLLPSIQSDTSTHLLPSHCWILILPEPSWFSQEVLISGSSPVAPRDFDLARTLMVFAGSLDLRQQPGCAQLLQTGIGDVQILQAPTHMFATHDLALAELALRRAHCLYRRQGARYAAVIQRRAYLALVLHIALAGAVDHFLDIGDQRHILARHIPGCAHIALGGVTGGDGVFFRASPP